MTDNDMPYFRRFDQAHGVKKVFHNGDEVFMISDDGTHVITEKSFLVHSSVMDKDCRSGVRVHVREKSYPLHRKTMDQNWFILVADAYKPLT